MKAVRPEIITISTKRELDEDIVKDIALINNRFINEGKGFIKVSVTITNTSMINEIEPNTADINGRINTLRLLSRHNIPTAVIIKPVLPFISIDEYIQIIKLTSEFTNLFLLGDLYVEKNSFFYEKFIKNKFKLEEKTDLLWLNHKPHYTIFKVQESIERKNQIIDVLIKNNLLYFDSDPELLKYISATLIKHS